ncbi:hypothetical protein [Leuconostoc citreum]|uniref:hypothetical protein n=1 Tax=Leuconostoc citreum TaxID=33964 RepID=UPI000660170A|nr:hypothetical protein [Leuconostoc citreum]MBU7449925.1 hypothetical protein [Leuconostoc citreum]
MGFYDQKVLADKQKRAQAQLHNIDFKLKKINDRSIQDLYDQHEIRTLTTQRDRLKIILQQLERQLRHSKSANKHAATQHFVRTNTHQHDL